MLIARDRRLGRIMCLATLLGAMSLPMVSAQDWKVAKSPLMTKWGKAITAETKPWQEYPRPQLVRPDWKCLNGLWEYAVTDKSASKPEQMDGKIMVPYCVESALSGVGKTVGAEKLLWYRTKITIPAEWSGKRYVLHFDAVDWDTTLFVNGKEVGKHQGGFDPFTFDITDFCSGTEQTLELRVWDPTEKGSQPIGKQLSKPEGIWYTPVTGIWQSVWIEPVTATHITRIEPVTELMPNGRTLVRFKVTGENIKPEDQVVVELKGKNGSSQTSIGLASGNGPQLDFKQGEVKLWTPDAPTLYPITVSIKRGDAVVDSASSYFAARTIAIGPDEQGLLRLLLNGKPLFQVGPLDQGWWPDGLLTPPSEDAMRYDLDVLKKMGMNMLRKHIKVEPSTLYHHCDKIGLLVWQDMPSAINRDRKHFVAPNAQNDCDDQFTDAEKAQFRLELKRMMDHLRFFPSICCWVPFNEGWGQHNTNEILKWTKEYDPTRLTNGPSGWIDRGYGDMRDMHRYPGPGMYQPMKDRVSVLGEFGGLGLPIKGHLWKDDGNWGYQSFQNTDELREAYKRLIYVMHPMIGKGLAAAVYTQTTDVEIEVNGFMTYDREVLKFDVAQMKAWHDRLFTEPPTFSELIPTSESAPQDWKYTLTKPADQWSSEEFDDSAWQSGKGGFGTVGTPNSKIGTNWSTKEIWIRRSFELSEVPSGEVMLRLHHDENSDVYINGVRAVRVNGHVVDYYEVPIAIDAQRKLRKGKNTIAIRCTQTGGGQYIDAGLMVLKP